MPTRIMTHSMRVQALLAALAVCGVAVSVQAADRSCEWGLRVADRSETPGRVLGPARLALQRDAGADTLGVADIAVLSEEQCATVNGHRYLDYGIEYHLDTDPDAPVERLSGSIVYTRTWSPSSRDSTESHRTLQLSGEFGRDVEAGRTAAHLGAAFAVFPTTRNGEFRRGPLGGEIGRADENDPVPLVVYELIPRVDYFAGYQPKAIEQRLDAAYAGGMFKAEWVPFASRRVRLHGFYASASWTGQRKMWGDDLLPTTYTSTSASVGYRFEQPGESRHSSIAIALDYEKGRSPDDGFVRSEGFVLALKYSLGLSR